MFQNITKCANSIGELAEVVSVNIKSLNTLSLAGNEKADHILKAAQYDVARQDVELNAKLEALKLAVQAQPKKLP